MAALRKYLYSVVNRNFSFNCQVINKYQILSASFQIRNINTSINYSQDRDPAPLFFNNDIQALLKKLTRINLEKVFRHKKLETKQLETPTYKFMTDEELKQTLEEAAVRANDMLQMPPVIKVREPVNIVLSRDPAIQGYDTAKFVFTDITYGISNRDRLIIVRDADGNLRKADWNTRHRMSQIYFPQPGREINTPKMFSEEYLKGLLQRKEYEFVLDRACTQFEPDDSEYQNVTSVTYQEVNNQNDFEILRSTRHFGPLVFFLTWFKMIDNLLLELITTSNINEANSLLNLYNRLHENECFGEDVVLESDDDTRFIERYIAEKSAKKGQLELALQSYKELFKQKQEMETDIKKAHGIL